MPVRAALRDFLTTADQVLVGSVSRAAGREMVLHVSSEDATLFDLNEFEEALIRDLEFLTWICRRPLQDLRYDEMVQPVGRVRRPSRGAAQHLVAHTEYWERWQGDHPIPREVLAVLRDDETNLYENRVARTLLVGAHRHLTIRLQNLRSHLLKNSRAQSVLGSGWFRKQDRLRELFKGRDVNSIVDVLDLAVSQLENLQLHIEGLQQSYLFAATPPRSHVTSLKVTNVLRRDQRYRHLPGLWRLWRSAADQDAEDRRNLNDPTLVVDAMALLAEVLVSKALTGLGMRVDPSTGRYEGFGAEAEVDVDVNIVRLRVRDTVGTRAVQFVGLASPLVTDDGLTPLEASDSALEWLRSVPHEDPVVLLHPADAGDLANVAPSHRWRVDDPGVDSPTHTAGWAIVPASPLMVDSLERVTRVVRWHLFAPVYSAYPQRVQVPNLSAAHREQLTELRSIDVDGNRLIFNRPITDEDAAALEALTPALGSSAADGIRHALTAIASIGRCPIYPQHRAHFTDFTARPNGTFVCTCSSCNSRWGIDLCGACGTPIPFLRPTVAVPDGERPSEYFGGDLLASLCEGAPAADVAPLDSGPETRALICPACRDCARSGRYPECSRCTVRREASRPV